MINPGTVLLLSSAIAIANSDWKQNLTVIKPGDLPVPCSQQLNYRFGWGKIKAAEVDILFSRVETNRLQLDIKGKTIGVARKLWRLDATHTALADASTLLPIRMTQTEIYSSESVVTELEFTDRDVTKFQQNKPASESPLRRKRFKHPKLLDIHTAILFIRSQKLPAGKSFTIVVYPSTSPYLATITVFGREIVKLKAGAYDSIKLDLKLQKINKSFALEPHSKFKRAYFWLSDDPDRVLLKAQADIYVGSIWAELENVKFLAP